MHDLSWKESYLVGETNIDREHKKLFNIATKAFQAVDTNQKPQKIKSIVLELIEYTKVHFHNEECFMKKVKYPKLSEHQKLHSDIIISMNKFLKTMNSKKIIEIEKELAHFVEYWFINHIVYEDKRVAQWVKSHNIEANCVTWKSEYKIGNALIDSEHQELFNIANEAFKKGPDCEKKDKIKATIYKLYEYMEKHFLDEEMYMKSINYNYQEEHKKIHKSILEGLNTFMKQSSQMDIETLESQLLTFIEVGLVQHIVAEDTKITRWLIFLEDLKEAKELREVE